MKHRIISSLQSAALALATWLLPTTIFATVEVDGLTYELDDATHTAVVASQTNKELESVVIPSFITCDDVRYEVTAIADCAFIDSPSLMDVRINSANLTSIGYSAFERCEYLTTLYLNEGLTTIGSEAFKDCPLLHNVNLPSTLRGVGYRAFYGCIFLATINIPKSVTYIGDEFVSGCRLKAIIVERTTPMSINEGVFAGIDKGNCLLCVPEGSKAAYQKAKVWRDFMRIEEGILETGACGESASYTIFSDGSMTITGTGEVTDFLPEKVSSNFIRELTIEEGITRIDDDLFSSVSLFYGWNLIEQWQSLFKISVPSTLASIGKLVFVETPWYNVQPDGVVYAGKVVCGVKGMDGQDVVLHEGTLGISPTAFLGVDIASLYIPGSVVSICPYVYSYYDAHVLSLSYDNIGSIVVNPENTLFDSRNDCNAIIETATNRLIVGSRNMTIPEGVTTIAPFALSGQTSVTIPASVTRIEEFAFINSYMYFIPGLYWGYLYFPEKSQIESIRMNGSTPPEVTIPEEISTDHGDSMSNRFSTFGGVGMCILSVPKGSRDAYANAPGWKNFAHIEEYDSTVVSIDALDGASATDAPRQLYDIDGRQLKVPARGVNIVRRGDKVTKEIVRY